MSSDISEYDTANKGFSIAAFVLGLAGLFVCPLIAGILAIVFAGIAMHRKEGIKGLAIAGLVLGIIECSLLLLVILFLVIVVIAAMIII